MLRKQELVHADNLSRLAVKDPRPEHDHRHGEAATACPQNAVNPPFLHSSRATIGAMMMGCGLTARPSAKATPAPHDRPEAASTMAASIAAVIAESVCAQTALS